MLRRQRPLGRHSCWGPSVITHMESPWFAKVSLKCLLRPQQAVASKRQQKIKVPGSLPAAPQNKSPLDFGPPETWLFRNNSQVVGMLQRRGGSGAQVPCSSSAPAGGRARHSWSCTADTPAGARRGARTAFFSRGPVPPGGCLCSAHRPSPSLQEEEKPAPIARILQAPQSRSNLNDSLKVGGGGSRKGAGAGIQRCVLFAPTPPAKLTSAHSATGYRTRSKSPHEPPGLPDTLACLRRWRVARLAGRKSRTSKVTPVFYTLL